VFSGTNVYETRAGNIKFSQHAEMMALQKFIKNRYGKTTNLSSNINISAVNNLYYM